MEEVLIKATKNYINNYNAKLLTCNSIDEIKRLIDSHEKFNIEELDLKKKKRAKNIINNEERCQALRANKTQCTRRKKMECMYCGTHAKGTPYGVIEMNVNVNTNKYLQVFTQEIQGILYYIDDNGNIYNTEDIINKVINPRKDGEYNLINDVYVRI
tara:strand:- start:785 stop:1255 length:471 start_codon:yes stop_codon:yes gene_type:complete